MSIERRYALFRGDYMVRKQKYTMFDAVTHTIDATNSLSMKVAL
jgi:hypothetical protein